jgi:transposase
MKSLMELCMEKHELTMRQMVTEIHQGKLNIDQAAAKFEVNRKTVQRWLDLVEEEAEADHPTQPATFPPGAGKKRKRRAVAEDSEEAKALKSKIRSLESQLEAATFQALYYSTLIRVAEDELGLDIEKKSVTASADRKPSEPY